MGQPLTEWEVVVVKHTHRPVLRCVDCGWLIDDLEQAPTIADLIRAAVELDVRHVEFHERKIAAASVNRSHPAFRMYTDFEQYRREGGRHDFETWAHRYGDDYCCDGAWLAADYMSSWRLFEDRQDRGEIADDVRMISFADWLAAETDGYRSAHLDDLVAS